MNTKFFTGCFIIVAIFSLCINSSLIASENGEVSYNILPQEGIRNTPFIIKGEGFGTNKGYVFLSKDHALYKKKEVVIKQWTDSAIICTVEKAIAPGDYFVMVYLSGSIFPIEVGTYRIKAMSYFISPNGDDTNVGNSESPFKTFQKGLSVLNAGDTLIITEGTYEEPLNISVKGIPEAYITIQGQKAALEKSAIRISGEYFSFIGFEIKNQPESGVIIEASAQFVTISDTNIHDCKGKGIEISGNHIVIEKSKIIGNVLNNFQDQGIEGAGITIDEKATAILLKRNLIKDNWGQGIAIFRTKDVLIRENLIKDNLQSNIFIDNATNVEIIANFIFCSDTPMLTKAGEKTIAIITTEQAYCPEKICMEHQLSSITIMNNIIFNCRHGFVYSGADKKYTKKAGLRNSIFAHNTVINSEATAILVMEEKETRFYVYNNIFNSLDNLAMLEDPNGNGSMGINIDYNLWINGPPWDIKASGTHDINSLSAGFASEKQNYTTQSFRLSPNSPAIDSAKSFGGAKVWQPARNDFEGKSRTNPDMGAMEADGSDIFTESEFDSYFGLK